MIFPSRPFPLCGEGLFFLQFTVYPFAGTEPLHTDVSHDRAVVVSPRWRNISLSGPVILYLHAKADTPQRHIHTAFTKSSIRLGENGYEQRDCICISVFLPLQLCRLNEIIKKPATDVIIAAGFRIFFNRDLRAVRRSGKLPLCKLLL
jgi:hypothetical protein